MAKKTNYLPWIIGGAAIWFLFRKNKSVNGIGTLSHGYLIAEKIDFLNDVVGTERYEAHMINKKEWQLFDKLENKLQGIPSPKERFTVYLSGIIEGWIQCKGGI